MTTSNLEFTRSSFAQLYIASCSGATSSTTGGGQIIFLLPAGQTDLSTLTLQQSWDVTPPGCYIFLDEAIAPGGEESFAQAAWPFLSNYSGARFAWIANPNAGLGNLQGTVITTYVPAGETSPVTAGITTFDFGGISVVVSAQCPVGVDTTNNWFTITQVDSTNTAIYLVTDQGTTNLYVVQNAVVLPVCGASAGCLVFPAKLGVTDSVPDLAHLDVGLRYYYPFQFAAADLPGDDIYVTSLRYPIIEEHDVSAPQIVWLYASLDPLGFDTDRTFFAFNPSDAGLPAGTTSTPTSCYRTTLGNRIRLAPLAGSTDPPSGFARLAFSRNPTTIPPSPSDPHYLVPMGDFTLTVLPNGSPATESCDAAFGDSTPSLRLMAGLSGVEYVGLTGSSGAVLSFFPGQSAFAPGFVPGQPPTGAVQAVSADTPKTSWAVVTPGSLTAPGEDAPSGLGYFAQPDSSVLFTPPSSAAGDNTAITQLDYLEVQASVLAATPTAEASIPLLPYAGVSGTDLGETFGQLERQVISPLRRKRLTAPPPTTSSSASATTPQGLVADVTNGAVSTVYLATTSAGLFGFTNISSAPTYGPALRSALTSNQLFLVISKAESMAQMLAASGTLAIGDPAYQFDLRAQNWSIPGTAGTTMILKFSDQRSVLDLVQDPDVWVQAGVFNTDPATTAKVIYSILHDAIESHDPDFANLVEAVSRPSWNGVLILNGMLTSLPAQLQGLQGGIPANELYAHHIGFTASAVSVAGSTISPSSSSLFGLVNYQAQGPWIDNGADYQFRVQSMKILFQNSQVASFSSALYLKIDTLLDAAVATTDIDKRTVRLSGWMQKQTLPDGTEVDSYLFETARGATVVLPLQSGVLKAVTINKAQFVTTVGASGSGSTDAQFLFWGAMDFLAQEGFDLFSFGDAGGNDVVGLSYANLVLNMAFSKTAPDQQTFSLAADRISLDLASTIARKTSLFARFPLQLTGFIQSKPTDTPAGLGYMGIQSPVSLASLNHPWFGLTFNLNLGTVGALAGEAGFVATVLAAWQPTAGKDLLFFGLRLPGSNGAKREISLEGVLGVTFKAIAMTVGTTKDGTPTYILTLNTIALRFLSKSFPPNGQINVVIFGNPDPSNNTTLGWYAAYAKNPAPPKSKTLAAITAATALTDEGGRS